MFIMISTFPTYFGSFYLDDLFRKIYTRTKNNSVHVSWVHCHLSLARPQVADGGDALQVWSCEYIE
jgi:hypothetical protein